MTHEEAFANVLARMEGQSECLVNWDEVSLQCYLNNAAFQYLLFKEHGIARKRIWAGVKLYRSSIPPFPPPSPIRAVYLASGSTIPYVEWLEQQLEELVPDCMKAWKKGF